MIIGSYLYNDFFMIVRNIFVVDLFYFDFNSVAFNFAKRGILFNHIFDQRESLHEDVGIIFVEIGQPTGKSFRKQVNICLRIDKEASKIDQTPSLTNRIKELFQVY